MDELRVLLRRTAPDTFACQRAASMLDSAVQRVIPPFGIHPLPCRFMVRQDKLVLVPTTVIGLPFTFPDTRVERPLIFIEVLTRQIPLASQVFFERGLGISANGNTLLMNGYWRCTDELITAACLIPVPGSMALLAIGGLVAARQHR